MYEHLAKLAEKIGAEIHAECPDPQEDASEITGEKIAEAIRAADLQWTTEPPTQAGWYWVKWMKGDDETVVLVTTPTRTDSHLVSIVPGFAQPFELHYFHLWLGPLLVPEPPEEDNPDEWSEISDRTASQMDSEGE